MVFEKNFYNSLGGHASVKSAITEDVALASLVRRSGEPFSSSAWAIYCTAACTKALAMRLRIQSVLWRCVWLPVVSDFACLYLVNLFRFNAHFSFSHSYHVEHKGA